LEGISFSNGQIVGYGEALGTQGLVHILAEFGAMLESLEINDSVLMLAEIGDQFVSALDGIICTGGRSKSSGIHEDLESSIGNVLIGALGSNVILRGPCKANSLTASILSHGILSGIRIGSEAISTGCT
jgi:hypothetical protein